jgi:hypothetical protein
MSQVDVPFPFDIHYLPEDICEYEGKHGKLLIAGQDGIQLAQLLILPQQISQSEVTFAADIREPPIAESRWNFEKVEQPIKGKLGGQILVGRIELLTSLISDKGQLITKLIPCRFAKVSCLFGSNKGHVGALTIHKQTPKIYFRLALTDSSITAAHLSQDGLTLICGTGSDQLQTIDLATILHA